MNMKINKIIVLAFASLVMAASCGPKVSDVTKITGVFSGEAPTKIHVSLPSRMNDITVPVAEGRFEVELPTTKAAYAMIDAGKMKIEFVPDGTPLTLAFSADNRVVISSKFPELSINERSKAFNEAVSSLDQEASNKLDSLQKAGADPTAVDKFYDEYEAKAKKMFLKTIDANKDNLISARALSMVQDMFSIPQLDSIIRTLSPEVASRESLSAIKKRIEIGRKTLEGQLFTDFEADGKKLSDYVGKGKYVLVDFWASWSKPCKQEIPNLKSVYGKFHGDNFDILSVAVQDEPKAPLDTAKAYGIDWNHMVNAKKAPLEIYGIKGIPHIILFGPDGTILKRGLHGAGIEAEVSKYVQPVN